VQEALDTARANDVPVVYLYPGDHDADELDVQGSVTLAGRLSGASYVSTLNTVPGATRALFVHAGDVMLSGLDIQGTSSGGGVQIDSASVFDTAFETLPAEDWAFEPAGNPQPYWTLSVDNRLRSLPSGLNENLAILQRELSPDVRISFDVEHLSGSPDLGVYLRYRDEDNYIMFRNIGGPTWELKEVQHGSVLLNFAWGATGRNGRWTFSLDGDSMSFGLDDDFQWQTELRGSYASGSYGFAFYAGDPNTVVAFDNLIIERPVHLDHVRIGGGRNSTSVGGSAIGAFTAAPLRVHAAELMGNSAPARFGGAIYNQSQDLEVVRSLFSGNYADYGGGAVYAAPGSHTTLVSSTFQGSVSSSSTQLPFRAGASIFADDAILDITDCTFQGNIVEWRATDGGGGAIGLRSSVATIRESRFSNNHVWTSHISGAPIGGKGGALGSWDSVLTIEDSVFDNNYVDTSLGHPAFGVGGALYVNGGSATLRRTRLLRNTANSPSGEAIWAENTLLYLDRSNIATDIVSGRGPASGDSLVFARSSVINLQESIVHVVAQQVPVYGVACDTGSIVVQSLSNLDVATPYHGSCNAQAPDFSTDPSFAYPLGDAYEHVLCEDSPMIDVGREDGNVGAFQGPGVFCP